MDAKMLTPENK